ncbi:class I SAM-dependent methyltransferase [Paenibacillus sp. JCM 10914]|uniref:class I SAM-dependent methyltransferase n=1 Tax=Paenibacillus sp. JCM 10914 TaxID=1236974 RepID=UPI0003CC9F5F|nr:class I SAM-dependent methyltransferase [Paenibacillus sp. JCM 10914]GAE07579.1 trans-aconitate 2-methyltransferase [Paenibacillus sp. JCM 10914]
MSEQTWKPQAYDQQLSFVSGYGKGLIEWLAPKPGEHILDLGCGTGDLAYEISASGARVTGMDASHEMIESAAAKYPSLTFIPEDGQNFTTATQYDAVFSNAALHWMRNAEGVIRSVHAALKPGGRLVAEFGGKGNVEGIYHAIRLVLLDSHGIDAATRNPWYYPSIGEYASLLEAHGFRVRMAYHFDRPTRLSGGADGIRIWLLHFGDHFFDGFTEQQKEDAINSISDITKSTLWNEDSYYADYKRLRIVAEKL